MYWIAAYIHGRLRARFSSSSLLQKLPIQDACDCVPFFGIVQSNTAKKPGVIKYLYAVARKELKMILPSFMVGITAKINVLVLSLMFVLSCNAHYSLLWRIAHSSKRQIRFKSTTERYHRSCENDTIFCRWGRGC